MNYLPSLTDAVFDRIKPLVPRSSLAIKVSFYIAQHYTVAKEFTTATKRLESLEIDPDIWLACLLRLREIARLIDYLVARLANEYEALETYLDRYWRSEDAPLQGQNDTPTDRLDLLQIAEGLKLLGCESAAIERLVDDWQGLYQELQAFVSGVEQLVNTPEISPIRIVSILYELTSPWSNIRWHALYHLGNYENVDAELYHLGFLGETLVIIEQLSAFVTKLSRHES